MNGITPQSANLKLAYAFPLRRSMFGIELTGAKAAKAVWRTVRPEKSAFLKLPHTLARCGMVPKVADLANLQAGIAVVNLFDKEYRMLNGSYGSGRGVRLWLSAQF